MGRELPNEAAANDRLGPLSEVGSTANLLLMAVKGARAEDDFDRLQESV